MTNAVLNNAIMNINALYDVVGELQGRLKELEDKQDRDLIGLPDLAVDTPILVRNSACDKWRRRYFNRWGDKGQCVTWDGGGTAWSAMTFSSWTRWKLPENEE